MRGSFVHNHVLLDPIEACLLELGASVKRECPVGPGRKTGYVDLVAEKDGRRLACEAELRPDRVLKDLAKARALKVECLLIVVPNGRVAGAVRRKLRGAPQGQSSPQIYFLPLGQARQRVKAFWRNDFPPECGEGNQIPAGNEIRSRSAGGA